MKQKEAMMEPEDKTLDAGSRSPETLQHKSCRRFEYRLLESDLRDSP